MECQGDIIKMHQLSWTVINRELLKKMNICKSCSLDYVIWRVLGELTNEHTVPSTVYIWKVTENEAGIRNVRHINVILVCIRTAENSSSQLCSGWEKVLLTSSVSQFIISKIPFMVCWLSKLTCSEVEALQ